jgi:hypothetical protein
MEAQFEFSQQFLATGMMKYILYVSKYYSSYLNSQNFLKKLMMIHNLRTELLREASSHTSILGFNTGLGFNTAIELQIVFQFKIFLQIYTECRTYQFEYFEELCTFHLQPGLCLVPVGHCIFPNLRT